MQIAFILESSDVADINFQQNRSVILTRAGINHLRFSYLIFDAVAYEEVINTPARVIDFAGLDSLTPPGIDVFCISVEVAEAVCKATCKELGEALSLFICKACRKMI